jgi:hypothetical protein
VSGRRKFAAVDFAQAARVSIVNLRKTAKDGWNLSAGAVTTKFAKGWLTAVDILEPLQGVTVGGEGCLDLFLMEESRAKEFEFESDLISPVIKGVEVTRWRLPEVNQVILYPYAYIDDEVRPAFTINFSKIKDQKFRATLKRLGISDALDFDKQIDRREQDIALRTGVNQVTVPELLRHRQSLDLVIFPSAAIYLVSNYEQLEGRVFEKKNIRQYNKQWYEYHRPRDPKVMLSGGKIITPRLFRKGEVRFALDGRGVIPQDSCICLSPTPRTKKSYDLLRKQLSDVLGRKISLEDVLKYCLAFLNSEFAQTQLIAGQRPTPKGFYAVTEKSLRRIPIPPPSERSTAESLINYVTRLVSSKDEQEAGRIEEELETLVNASLKI